MFRQTHTVIMLLGLRPERQGLAPAPPSQWSSRGRPTYPGWNMAQRGRRPGAHFECDFVLHDPRILSLSLTAWGVYSKLWVIAVDARRVRLPYSRYTAAHLARVCNCDVRTLEKCLQRLCNSTLIRRTSEYIEVVGVHIIHDRLQWKDLDDIRQDPEGNSVGNSVVNSCVILDPIPEPNHVPEPEPNNIPPKRKSKKAEAMNSFQEEFREHIWPIYPRKVAKKPGLERFTKLRKEGVPLADLLAAVRNYAEATQGREMQHIKHCASLFSAKTEAWKEFVDGIPEGERRGEHDPSRRANEPKERYEQLFRQQDDD